MWLLNVCSWEMREFISHKQAPPYAILSHTWDEEEVMFGDWQYEPFKQVELKEGYKKIKHCCEQAAADGLEWVWIDTCCIDKKSSAELSEAINSMFQWYRSATVCYAYLCDVLDDIESNLARCRWVTRGWTLQELIAPREVVFYSRDWQQLGTRSMLSAQLTAVTGIDEVFLTGRSLDKASIAQRMSWASRRSTSREEDEAYCLLGMFSVNMPLIYGEGSRAFRRLQEILVTEYPEDHSLFAWGKIVERLPNEVGNDKKSQTRPLDLEHTPGKAGHQFFGLFADRPRDFQHSGQLVRAPDMNNYFLFLEGPSVSALTGRTARVTLPRVGGVSIALSLKRPPIVQVIFMGTVVLLCGRWNDSHTDFHFVALPLIFETLTASRSEEIIMNNEYTRYRLNALTLWQSKNKLTIEPILLRSPRNGDVVIRRHNSQLYSAELPNRADIYYLPGSLQIPVSFTGLLRSSLYDDGKGLGLIITTLRLQSLDHWHDDPTQGRYCGGLGVRVSPYALLLGSETRDYCTVTIHEDSESPTYKTTLSPMRFRDNNEALDYFAANLTEMEFGRTIVVPQDEWRFSISGVADVYISVERMFLDGYDSDDDSEIDVSHPFVDVMDIVVNLNKEEDDTVEENGVRHGGHDGVQNGEVRTEVEVDRGRLRADGREKANQGVRASSHASV